MRKWIPVDSYNLTAVESWLEEMAQRGWMLEKMGRTFTARFTEGEPGRYLYRITVAGQDNREDWEKLGWGYVCPMHPGFEVYRVHGKSRRTPPLTEEAGKRIRALMNRILWNALVLPLLLVFLLAYGFVRYGDQAVMGLLDDKLVLSWILLLVYQTSDIALTLRRRRYLQRLKSGEPTTGTPERRKRARGLILSAALLLAVLGVFLIRDFQAWEKPVTQADIECVTLDDLEGETISYSEYRKEFGNTVSYASSMLAPRQYEFRMSGQTASGREPVLRIQLYDLVFGNMADAVMDAVIRSNLSWASAIQQQELSVEGTDRAVYAGYYDMQYLFMRQGNRVLAVFYLGDQDLDEQAGQFVSMLP